MNGKGAEIQGSPAQQAADWLVRLQSNRADEAEWLAFEAWLAASPQNWAAYDMLERLSVEIEARADEVRAALKASAPKPALRWVPWSVAAAAAIAATLLIWLVAPRPPVTQFYETAIGEIREITLADGSHVSLNTASRLQVALAKHERRVTLGEGEAAFDVAKDPARPFLIAAGDRTVRVVGTAFDLAQRGGRLSITVQRGVVEVSPASGAAGAVLRLVRGDRFVHRIGSAEQRVETAAAPDDAMAWRDRRLIYDETPLEEVAADLNRYFDRPILVQGEAKRLKFSGVLVVVNQDAVMRRLEELLPVAVSRSADAIALRPRPPSG